MYEVLYTEVMFQCTSSGFFFVSQVRNDYTFQQINNKQEGCKGSSISHYL